MFDLIARAGVTLFFGVPTMFIAMQQHPRWASGRLLATEAGDQRRRALPAAGLREILGARVDFKTGYGLTEAGPNTFWLPPDDVRRKPGAVGFPLFHVDVQIVDWRTGASAAPTRWASC